MAIGNFWKKRKASFVKGLNAIVQFINNLLSNSEDPEFRNHLEGEIERSGLHDYLADMESEKGGLIGGADFAEFAPTLEEEKKVEETRLQNLEVDSPEYCVLLFLQRMLSDENAGPTHSKMIDLLKISGLNIELIQKLKEKPNQDDSARVEELQRQLEEALQAKAEMEAKLNQLCENADKIESSKKKVETRKSLENERTVEDANGISKYESDTPPPPAPPMLDLSSIPPPPPPPMLVPPPIDGIPPLAPVMDSAVPLPPSMPNENQNYPHGLKPKKKWHTTVPLKKANWTAIPPQKITEKSFWINVEEEKLANEQILRELDEKFAPVTKSKPENEENNNGTLKKIKKVKILEARAAQNLSILLRGSLKQINYDEIEKLILRCDDKVLTGTIVDQLIQYLPSAEQFKKFKDYKDSYEELTEAEQFCLKISEIERPLPRLKSLQFMHFYHEVQCDMRPNIQAVIYASKEVKNSKKFAKILELTLLLGNYMNSGSRNERAFGFEISFLPKMKSLKHTSDPESLLHSLISTIELSNSNLINFYEEMPHIDEASRVSLEAIKKSLNQLNGSILTIQVEINNNRKPQSDEDKFNEVMKAFIDQAKKEYAILQNLYEEAENEHEILAEFYVFEKKKYDLKDLFTDLKVFKDDFIETKKYYYKKREIQEKKENARMKEENANGENGLQGLKPSLTAMEFPENDMSSLLEILRTTGEFSKQKRKRQHGSIDVKKTSKLPRTKSRTDLTLDRERRR